MKDSQSALLLALASAKCIGQGSPSSVLEGRCPAEFSSNPNQTHLKQLIKVLIGILAGCVEASWSKTLQDTGPPGSSLMTPGIGDLHAFSVDSDCIHFGPGDCGVTLWPRITCLKSLSTPFRTQTVSLSALSSESSTSRDVNAQIRCAQSGL